MLVVGILGGNGRGRCEHAANTDSGREAVDRHERHARCGSREEHADADQHEAQEDGRSPAEPVGDVADNQRADAQAEELH
jgi:hypothetical protein